MEEVTPDFIVVANSYVINFYYLFLSFFLSSFSFVFSSPIFTIRVTITARKNSLVKKRQDLEVREIFLFLFSQ